MRLARDALEAGPTPLSSHGLGVAEATALACTLYGDAAVARLAIVGIAIERSVAHAVGMSPAVAAAAGRPPPHWPPSSPPVVDLAVTSLRR